MEVAVPPAWRRRCAKPAGTGLVIVGAAAALYFRFLRRWHLHWGATAEEVSGEVAGDELIPHPDIVATRVVEIDAPPSAIWPWLVQMGPGRGGGHRDEVGQMTELHSKDPTPRDTLIHGVTRRKRPAGQLCWSEPWTEFSARTVSIERANRQIGCRPRAASMLTRVAAGSR